MSYNDIFDINEILKTDFKKAKANFKYYFVGDENNNLENKVIYDKIKNVEKCGIESWQAMNKSSDAAVLFGQKDVNASVEMGYQYGYLAKMARAYGTYGSKLYHNKELKKDIVYALNWLCDHYYGQNEIDGVGWRDTSLFNWWDWYVHVPNYLEETIIILESELDKKDITRWMACFNYIRTIMCTERNVSIAMSRIKVVTLAALIMEDVNLMYDCMEDINSLLETVHEGEGVYEDDTYIVHGYYHYVGSYATDILINRLMLVTSMLTGTGFECRSKDKYNMARWMYFVFEPLMYKGTLMSMVNGRAFAYGLEFGTVVIQGAITLIGVFSPEDDTRLKMLIRRNVDDNNIDYLLQCLSLTHAQTLLKIMQEDIVPCEYILAKVYYRGDRVVQHTANYTVGIAMHSTRMANYECINDANKDGWYTGDGMLYVYNDSMIGYDRYGAGFYDNVNKYRLPGTTEDVREREARSIAYACMGKTDFVGGASIDDKYAVAVMDFKAFSNDKLPAMTDTGYGGDPEYHINDLNAKKSWFMFDDEIVALGAGIKSTMNSEVRTYVDNRKLTYNNIENRHIYIDGREVNTSGTYSENIDNPGYVCLDCFGGYYFPEGGNVIINKTGGEHDFAEIMLSHGVNPVEKTYSYVILPGKSNDECRDYSNKPDIEIISNTDKLAAVSEKNTGITAAVFYESGICKNISVDKPMIVICRKDGDRFYLSLSDPSQKLGESGGEYQAEIVISETMNPIKVDSELSVDKADNKTVIKVNFKGAVGKTINAEFVIK